MRNKLNSTIVTYDRDLAAGSPKKQGFHPSLRFLFVVFVLTLAFDTLSTVLMVRQCGPSIELHPVVRVASEWMGPVAGPILGALFKAGGMIFVAHYAQYLVRFALSASAILYTGAACYNLAGAYTGLLR